jgi:subtilisin family serine protease
MNKHSAQRRITARRFQVERLESRIQLSTSADGTLAVQLALAASLNSLDQVAAASGATVQSTSVPGLVEVQGSSASLAAVTAATTDNPAVQYAAPVQTERATLTPNDPYFTNGSLWGLNGTYGINAPTAWNTTTGSPATVTIADIDTGADYDQPDLYQNIWINQAEIPASRMKNLVDVYHDGYISWRDLNNPINIGPGKITDVNGDGVIDAADILSPMILNAQGQDTGLGGWANPSNTQDGDTAHPDDLIGWNFVKNTNNPLDDNGHGTATAGIIAAMGNNGTGVVGVNWSAQVMVLKFLNNSGTGTDVGASEAIEYAANHGANVANASWGAGGTDTVVADAITYAESKNMVFVAAAGNNSTDTDTSPFWPADSGVPNVISVGALAENGTVAGFSNYGLNSVALFAPGAGIDSTQPNGQYGSGSGTSFAAPFVTGTVALLDGLHPTWTYSQIINQMETTATEEPSTLGQSITGGILNAGAAVAPVYPAIASFVGTDTTTQGNWKTAYGSSGFDVSQDPSTNDPTLPSYATLNITGGQNAIWASTTSDPRAPEEAAPGSTSRIAGAWYSPTTLSFNLSLSDGQSHLLALYALDWGGATNGDPASERIDVINNATGTVLNSQSLTGFSNGEYLVWNVSGSITIRVTNFNSASDAVISGLFLGGPPAGPSVATPASSGPNPVTGTSTALSVLGADANYPAQNLTYTWAATSVPAGAAPPTFSVNGTNVAQNTTATFSQAGTYAFQVTITDPGGLSTTSNVTVTVNQTLTSIAVSPAPAALNENETQTFTAIAYDQFAAPLADQPSFTWSVDSGGAGGTVSASGLYTAPSAGAGSDTVRATAGGVSGTASVAVTAAPAAIMDGGFESGSVGTGTYGSFAYDPTGTAWSFSGTAGVAGNGSGFTSGNPNAPEGTQVGFLQVTGSFSQVVAGMAAGTYELSFDAAQRGNHGISQQNFEVLVDGAVVGTFTPSGTSYVLEPSTAFSVAAGSHTIAFVGLDSAGGDNTAFVDNIVLSPLTVTT